MAPSVNTELPLPWRRQRLLDGLRLQPKHLELTPSLSPPNGLTNEQTIGQTFTLS